MSVDFPMRENLAEGLFNKRLIQDLLHHCWPYEATVTKNGFHNCNNEHEWAGENPHTRIEGRHQDHFRINL